MTINSEKLISDLIETTRVNLNEVEQFNQLSIDDLNFKLTKDSWSVLETIEHLNLYGDYYLPEIKSRINKNSNNAQENFNAGVLGNYFTKLMEPKESMKKMKTLIDKDPIGSQLSKSVIDTFLKQQQTILELLNKSRVVNLTKTKTSISISKFIKLRLGDTFRFVIAHNQRHILQAQNVLKNK